MTTEGLYLGGGIDQATGERTDSLVDYDPSDLTTHGVIVGMTGSGKTGLGVIFLEEALKSGVPALIIDPKGDMTNLMLTFPDLAPSDFVPWVDEGEARRDGKTVAELAASKAELWANGLHSWDLSGATIADLEQAADFTIYTPGSSAGTGIDIVGSLACPELDWDAEAEVLRDEIQGFASGLLGLIGIDADPISSKEHILIANLIEHAWRQGDDLDLATLLGQIQAPPLRKLGVFDVDSFFPVKERNQLAMRLNGLIASPAFTAWTEGVPLDIPKLLWTADGKPRAAIVYIAHLSDEERQFVVAMLVSRLVTWMRSQQGSSELRALVYMDEVFGFVPPTAEPPAKKPILTMLKQARAFGVGMLLSTQNPVDLDYKAMSNAGTWCVGRLQTERDKARILEALQSATGDSDVGAIDASISALDKRQFLLHNTRDDAPTIFTTRWALSYLAGPLTREQITRLSDTGSPGPHEMAPTQDAEPDAIEVAAPNQDASAAEVAGGSGPADDEATGPPSIADGVPVRYAAASAPWLAEVGGGRGPRHEAALVATVELVYDDTAADLVHPERWEAVYTPLTDVFDASRAVEVDHDDRDFTSEPPSPIGYAIPGAPLDTKSYFSKAEAAIKEHLYRSRSVTVLKNPQLRMYSRVGEDRAAFLARCDAAAQAGADDEAAKLRDKYESRIDRAREQLLAAQRRADELAVDLEGARNNQLLDQAGAVIGVLLGRGSTRDVTGSAKSRASLRSKGQRLETAEAKARDKAESVADLEHDLREDLEQINDEWEAKATEIEEVEIGLEKDDIAIVQLALVWLPR